jgi:hypothetical protein
MYAGQLVAGPGQSRRPLSPTLAESWQRRIEREGFYAAMEALRDSTTGLKRFALFRLSISKNRGSAQEKSKSRWGRHLQIGGVAPVRGAIRRTAYQVDVLGPVQAGTSWSSRPIA